MKAEKHLTDSERLELETFLKARLETDRRNVLAILIALYSGARAQELLAIDWTDVDLKTGALRLKTLKRYKRKAGESEAEAIAKRQAAAEKHSRTIALEAWLLPPLRKLKLESPAKPWPISYNRLGEVWRHFRTVAKPFHSLRHSYATDTYEKSGHNIRFVSKCLGHANIATTSRYLEKTYSVNEYKKIMGMG